MNYKRPQLLLLAICVITLTSVFGLSKEKQNTEIDPIMDSFRSKIVARYEQEKRLQPDNKLNNQDCVSLVEQAAKHLLDKNLEIACSDFRFLNQWYKGDIFIFVLDEEGYILCHGDNSNVIWKNINFAPNFIGEPIFNTIKTVDEKGNWVNYRWNNGYKSAYIKKITLNQSTYYVGAGYFPQSKEYIAEQLVKTAIQYFQTTPADVVFTRISNSQDVFVFGNITMYVIDETGHIYANSFEPAFVGQNFKEASDNITKSIINSIKGSNKSAVVTNYWKDTLQYNYVEKYYDPRSKKNYYFVGTFVPEINEISALNQLDKVIKHTKSVGTKKAFQDFSNPSGDFNSVDISVIACDFKGNNLANSEFPVLVGQNLINRKDKNGKFVIQELINLAKKNGYGVVTSIDKNSSQKIFFRVLDIDGNKVIVGVSVYIQTRSLTVESWVEKAFNYIKNHSLVEAMNAFSDPQKEFYYGNIYMFMYNAEGIALVNGEYKNMIWQDYIRTKDDRGEKTMQRLIELAKRGGGWLTYNFRGAQRRIYVRPIYIENKVAKTREMFILGSGYFF